jgi:hypothetical protein
MLTNKQSLLLCAFIVLGFCISGGLGILDNYVVIAVLILGFLAIIINLFLLKDKIFDEDE